MRSENLRVDELYEMLREFYINRFPQRISDNFDMTVNYKTMLIEYLNGKFFNAEIKPVNGVYKITGDIVDAYKASNPPEGSTAYLIAKLSEEDELKRLLNDGVKDLEDLDFWLKIEGFVKEGVASEKLLKQKTIEIIM
ncbi:hypothetical protein H0K13_001022 [Salmonella enterica]|nr:hypothetical protein CGA23_08075 [Salmonella enterica subsp. enterica]EAA2696286.1 hypothetical protein [Salmonella enterica]ECL7191994.1 hypothetical protein [Salmonella enterica subsp. enterica serovar Muenchen]EHF3500564.1 hypothetical protein [Salmonella enterica subsp. enterica serovar 6,8,20:d-]HBJ6609015.1 hypothetical protein [Salmonella enterica subsp. enterica serovar 6,8:d:-]